ncbi:MCE-family lipoprotein [Mycolicibacterium phlei]|uniref:Mammalian cell entry protein n=1 Tax=Mycolicibacterium phlei DSM 43239 = CCUG 21000 TaxID=1226750 RepID=A0A5N5UZR9_MYCPH|nr:mce related protein [Mycolicibacterium phlei]EID18287.1 virulence factor Mce family protein [Mycolicibacterium phlei RIVM601174]KAB7754918.1 mammalian cell entry protein [Mycolicibacterium phlei DSM 43239 = CCUG 21000]VEG09055.1 MCE-family lipoprotein [Mycobacteroides chelonae]KXW64603.1 mammalian cell entry protein [Mycolicibacterium phlei DSM 43239 = CCUG 21000]
MIVRRTAAIALSAALTASACSFQGVNSLPLPGAVGRGSGASVYHVELANVGTLESNSPVMIDDVVVGSVGAMRLHGWHIDLDVSLKPDVVVPANAVASVGQTSLLGSMHVALDPPPGEPPRGRLQPGATIGLDRTSTYPSTEQTLASLAAVVNGGGLGRIGDIIANLNTALAGRAGDVRDLITRLDTFVGTLYEQRDDIIATIEELNRFAQRLGDEQQVLTRALRKIPPALDVLVRERQNFTTALRRLGEFSDLTSGLIRDTQADLVTNLENLAPTLRALADVGPEIDSALAWLPTFPMSQNLIDRGIRGDYMNLWVTVDLTNARIKRSMLLGTALGQDRASLVPAPGDPGYDDYFSKYPLGVNTPPPFGEIPNAAPAPWEPGGGG